MSRSFSPRKKRPSNPPTANGHPSQFTQHSWPVCTWSAHTSHSRSWPSPFPRNRHTLTTTATAAGELYLFGGYVHGRATSDLYVFSTRDFSTTLLQASGEVPNPRVASGSALIGTTLLICGGTTSSGDQNVLNHDSLYILNLVSREWTRVVVNGPGPGGRHYHTVTMVGSELFVFGGLIGENVFNDMWRLDLNNLKSQLFWESHEPAPGDKKPLPRSDHVSVTTGEYIIIFGGNNGRHYYNDTWSFDISTRKWTELQCTGTIPSPRGGHAAVLVDDVMYVYGGRINKSVLDDLVALQLSTQRWIRFHNEGSSPHGRSAHTMASDGTRVFVHGGCSKGSRADEISLIHVFDTKDVKYPDHESNAVNPNENAIQFARKSSAGPPTQEQLQYPEPSSSEPHGSFSLQNASLAVLGSPASPQITHMQNPGPSGWPSQVTDVNSKPRRVPEDDVIEGSTECNAKSEALHSSEGEVERSELERQLSVSPAAQTERDHLISQLTDELALKGALLEQAEANAAEAANRAGLELRERADRLLEQKSLVEQRDADLVDMQTKFDELVVSRDRQVEQYENELTNVRAKLETKESELEAVQLRLVDAEEGWTKSKAELGALRAQTATGSMNMDENQITRILERVGAIAAESASKRWNEKSIEEMECRNEG